MQLVNPLFGAYFATFPRTLIPYDTPWVMIPHPVDGPLTTGVIIFVHFPPDTVTVSAEIGHVIAHFVDHTIYQLLCFDMRLPLSVAVPHGPWFLPPVGIPILFSYGRHG
jgi:hypothetical protein